MSEPRPEPLRLDSAPEAAGPPDAAADGRVPRTALWALSLTSGSLLALQVILTRMFSITIWHHFTYLVIGVALLGGGAAATLLSLRDPAPAHLASRLGRYAVALAVSILAGLAVIALFPIDPLRRAGAGRAAVGLVSYFGVLFAMFYSGGLVVAGAFRVWSRHAHRLYGADLAGAGLGALLAVPLVEQLGGPGAMTVAAVLALAASALLTWSGPPRLRAALIAGTLVVGGVCGWIASAGPIVLPVPASKDLGWAQRRFGVLPEYSRWNAVGPVDVLPEVVVPEPMIVGGVSPTYLATPEFRRAGPFHLRLVTIDGTSMTGLYRFDGSDADLERFRFLDHAIISAPFHVGISRPVTLQIGTGGGIDLILARLQGARDMTAIELNADVVGLLRDRYAAYSGRLTEHPRTSLVTAEGRSFLTRTERQYDVIQGIGLDNVAALSGGAYVLAESYLYTVESVALALRRLTQRGVFSWTRNTDNPPREMLRLVGLAAEALRRHGVTDVASHVAVVANDSSSQATMLVRTTPFDRPALDDLRTWAAANGFSLLHDPAIRLQTTYSDYLHATDPRSFEANYPYKVGPVTDDAPFFYSYFRWSSLRADWAGVKGNVLSIPVGNLILLIMLLSSLAAAGGAILLPLGRHARAGNGGRPPWRVLAYFAALGVGYTFVEIVLVQRFTLFIGSPALAVSITVFALLASSAAGSLWASRRIETDGQLRLAAGGVAALVLAYVIWLPGVCAGLQGLPDLARLLASVGLVGPLGAAMGMPFPSGLHAIGRATPRMIPWAWGMNGLFSVLASTSVILVAMSTSFTVALACASACYAAAACLAGGFRAVGPAGRPHVPVPA